MKRPHALAAVFALSAFGALFACQSSGSNQPAGLATIAPTAAASSASTAAPTTAPTAAPTSAPTTVPTLTPTSAPTTAPTSAPTTAPSATPVGASPAPTSNPALVLAVGFHSDTIASVGGARELAPLPNGDLLVGTTGSSVMIVPSAESSGAAGAAKTFITLSDSQAEGVAFGPDGNIYVATNHHLWKIAYANGAQTGSNPQSIANVRQGAIAPNSDGDVHSSTSVAVSSTTIYLGVGSSCNSCTEVDPTRASIQQLPIGGGTMTTRATRIRNAIALAINPATGSLWAGGAGQDGLPTGHPYEYVDNVSAHSGIADYGWPVCEENHTAYSSGANCTNTVAPLIEYPAYTTHIGATFYPANQSGTYTFPAQYRGGLFVASHGSWHCCPSSVPKVTFVPMSGDAPATVVNWTNPTVQWQMFMWDTRSTTGSTTYGSRFTGVAVGSQGSLFVGDDQNGQIYRIRP
jgi:glucose/arabinose dehydrogenase